MRALLVALALSLAACGGSGEAGTLRAGAGTAVLDVPIGHSHGGYLQSSRIGAPHPDDDPGSPFAELFPATRGMESAPRAKAIWLERGAGRLVLAQIDASMITAELTARVVDRVRERIGIDLGETLILTATHTHAGPGRFSLHSLAPKLLANEPEGQREALAHGIDTFSPESTDRIAGSIAEAIAAARESLRPARFGWAQGENDTASRDRRCQDDWQKGKGDKETAVTVLRIEDESTGDPIAVLFHFAMHGTLYDWNNRSFSVDAPGHAEYAVERLFDEPVVAIYLQGAAAAVSPNGDPAGHHGSQAMDRVGWDLARTVGALWSGITPSAEVDVAIAQRWIRLDRKTLGYAEGEFPEDGAMLCFFLDSSCGTGPKDPSSIDCLGKGLRGGGKYVTRLAVARIGDLALLTLPGEPSKEIAVALAAEAKGRGFAAGIVLGYAQDHDGYILGAEDWLSGGSETNISFWGWRYGPYVVEQSKALLREFAAGWVRPGENAPARASYDYVPVAPTASMETPAVVDDALPTIERLQELHFAFAGGDPALGTPEVRLQRLDTDWADVLENGWIPVSNLRGPQLPTFYEGTPTWRADPLAAARSHRWSVVYEAPRDLATGRYRLVARGEALVGGVVTPYELASRAFELQPSTALRVDGTIDGDALHATLLYPVRAPSYSQTKNDEDWQLGGFRGIDPRFGPQFSPVLDGSAIAPLLADGAPQEARFVAMEVEGDAPDPWVPGGGPGFEAAVGAATSVEIPAGALQDPWGNTNAAARIDR